MIKQQHSAWSCYQLVFITFFINIVIITIIILKIGFPFVYPLDDTYIHMSIGRTIAENGVWGINPSDPASASSSPLFSIVLAALFLLFGHSIFYEYVPLGLNILALAACLSVWAKILHKECFLDHIPTDFSVKCFKTNQIFLLFYLILLSFATPFFLVVIIGMEHTLQIAISTLFLYIASRNLAQFTAQDFKSLTTLFILSLLVVSTRYESILLIAPLIVLSFVKKKYKFCAALTAGVIIPLVMFGLLWSHDGGWGLPNSIMMKKLQNSHSMPQRGVGKITLFSLMLISLSTLSFSFFDVNKLRFPSIFNNWRLIFTMTVLFTSAVMLKIGIVGWLYRYEAIVISLNLLSIILLIDKYRNKRAFFLVMAALLVILPYRSLHSSKLLIEAPYDRRWEHVKPAHLIRDLYSNKTVIVNDIGLAAWLSPHTRILDIAGLSNNQIAAFRMENNGLTPQKTKEWAINNKASIAILQICWSVVYSSIPDDWLLVSVWQGPRNVIFGDTYVGFYAINKDEAKLLKENLMKFSTPENVRKYYIDEISSPFHTVTPNEIRQKGWCNFVKSRSIKTPTL